MRLYIPWMGLFQWLIAGISGHNCLPTLGCNFLTSRCIFFPGGMRTKVKPRNHPRNQPRPNNQQGKSQFCSTPCVGGPVTTWKMGVPSVIVEIWPRCHQSHWKAQICIYFLAAIAGWIPSGKHLQFASEKGPVEIVDLPIKKGWFSQIVM